MDEDHPEWFNTPELNYLNMKKEILRKFRNKSDWGEFGTRKQVIALAGLLDFLRKTADLADQFPHLLGDIQVENKNLLLKRTIPISDKLYEQLLLAVVQVAEEKYNSLWEQPISVTLDTMEKFLLKQKSGCLALHQHQVWSEVHSCEYSQIEASEDSLEKASELFEESSSQDLIQCKADLNKLRNKIYSRIQFGKGAQEFLVQYHTLTEVFLDRFDSKVTVKEAKSLRKRVSIARNAARGSRSKAKTRRPVLRRGQSKGISTHVPKIEFPQSDIEEQGNTISIGASSSADENESGSAATDEESEESKTVRTSATPGPADWDHLLLSLPEVPYDAEPVHAGTAGILEEDIDDNIQKRLTKLQFFSRTWSKMSENPDFSSISVKPDLLQSEEEIKVSEPIDFVPVKSTEAERQAFNDWYYAKVGQVNHYQPSSDLSTSSHLTNPTLTSLKDTSLINPSSEPQMADLTILKGQASDTSMTYLTSYSAKPDMSKQHQLLDVITNLCYMQLNVVTMVMTATILLDKLSKITTKAGNIPDQFLINNPDPALIVTPPSSKTQEPDHSSSVQGVYVSSDSISLGTVTSWRMNGIVYTKLF